MDSGDVALIAGIIWLAYVVVWVVSAFAAKRTTKRSVMPWIFRAVVIACAFVAIKWGHAGTSLFWLMPSADFMLQVLGLAVMLAGLGIAFWARYHLGSNWGMPMSHKDRPELVTSGPYAYVRNPIYTGILLLMIGSIWTLGAWWLFISVASCAYFICASSQEEKIMAVEFPDAYPAYKARTKMLIPYVL